MCFALTLGHAIARLRHAVSTLMVRVLTNCRRGSMARRVRRSSGPLDLRSQAILRAVIEEYVTTAAPVGSHALVERYRLGVSSATVRAVLAELEAGRPPDAPAHLRRPRSHRAGLPLLRRVHRGLRAAAPGRAADDPPPVRPGGVRERALVPARGHHPRLGDPRRRPRHARQAQLGAPASPRPRERSAIASPA